MAGQKQFLTDSLRFWVFKNQHRPNRSSNQSINIGSVSFGWFFRILMFTSRWYCLLVIFTEIIFCSCSHSFEYLDEDNTIICTMIGGIGAVIKVSQGWPLSDSPLKLISLKNSDHYTKGISLSLICKVEVRFPNFPYLFSFCSSYLMQAV